MVKIFAVLKRATLALDEVVGDSGAGNEIGEFTSLGKSCFEGLKEERENVGAYVDGEGEFYGVETGVWIWCVLAETCYSGLIRI